MRAEIASKQAMFTLRQLHAELAGKMIDNKNQATRLVQSMKHVEAVLKLMDPEFKASTVAVRRRKPNPYFKRGTIFRSVLQILRESDVPLMTTEIVTRLLAMKGITEPTPTDSSVLFGAVQASLRVQKGKLVDAHGTERPFRWSVRQ